MSFWVAEGGVQTHQEQGVDHQPGREEAAASFEAAALSEHSVDQFCVADRREGAEAELTRRRYRRLGRGRLLSTDNVDLGWRQVDG
jgi:hypothetical protein